MADDKQLASVSAQLDAANVKTEALDKSVALLTSQIEADREKFETAMKEVVESANRKLKEIATDADQRIGYVTNQMMVARAVVEAQDVVIALLKKGASEEMGAALAAYDLALAEQAMVITAARVEAAKKMAGQKPATGIVEADGTVTAFDKTTLD